MRKHNWKRSSKRSYKIAVALKREIIVDVYECNRCRSIYANSSRSTTKTGVDVFSDDPNSDCDFEMIRNIHEA